MVSASKFLSIFPDLKPFLLNNKVNLKVLKVVVN